MGHDGSVSEAQGEPFGHFGHNQMMRGWDEGPAAMPGRLSHDPIGWQPPQGEPVAGPSRLDHNQMIREQDERPSAGPDHLNRNWIGWQEPVAGPSHLNRNQSAQEQDDGPAAGSDYGLMGWGQHGGSVADPYGWLRSSDSILGETGYQSGPFNQD
jgi:hypothetical protein